MRIDPGRISLLIGSLTFESGTPGPLSAQFGPLQVTVSRQFVIWQSSRLMKLSFKPSLSRS